jgi:signal transduction histidine kinase
VEWDEGGNPTRMLGTHTDITEQVETKIELARLARFPEENPNPVLRLNEQRNVLYANDAARRTLDSGLMDDAAFREAFDSAVGGDSPVRGEVKLGEVYYAVSIVPLAGMGLLNVYGFDITKRKNAEKETNLLARFPSENPNPVMRLSEEGELLYSNEACSYLLRHGVRGNSVFRAGISTALEMGSPERIEMRVGDLFYMLTIAPIPELQAVNVYGMDVTARQKTFDSLIEAEARLKETVSELQRSNYDLEQFAYISSHDLQEPLRMVSNYVQLLERRYKNRLDDEADEFIGYAVDGVRRMNELIEGLLEYSRIQNRSRQNESVDCNALLKTILHDSARTIMQSDGRVTADPLPIISGDRIQLGRVFQNIIANALKFHGEQPPEVHVSALDEGSCWHFKISDNGIGIEPEYAEKIFGLFKRLHGREKYTGTGIGLAVCKRIIERHGGRIWVEPGTEAGCVFHFTLQKEGHHET